MTDDNIYKRTEEILYSRGDIKNLPTTKTEIVTKIIEYFIILTLYKGNDPDILKKGIECKTSKNTEDDINYVNKLFKWLDKQDLKLNINDILSDVKNKKCKSYVNKSLKSLLESKKEPEIVFEDEIEITFED